MMFKKKSFFLLLSIVSFLLLIAVPGYCKKAKLSFTIIFPDNPCISTCQELQDMQNDLTKNYCLAKDIECKMTNPSSAGNADPKLDFDPFGTWGDRKGFIPVGNHLSANKFKGTLDGRGHVIKDLYMNRDSEFVVGLFGGTSGANIQDVGLVNANITSANNMTGSLVGNGSVTIRNCYSTGGSVSAGSSTGGLVGVGSVTMENSYFTGSVTGVYCTGGLVGTKSGGTIENCYSTGSVSGGRSSGGLVGTNGGTINKSYSTSSVSGGWDTGGLVGKNARGATIENSYSTGSVSGGDQDVGGFVGRSGDALGGATIKNCYSTGSVTVSGGFVFQGGFLGHNWGGTVENSYWDITTSGWGTSWGGGTGMVTADMKDEDNFSGWAFESEAGDGAPWKLDTITPAGNYYPCLSWQANGICPK